MKWSGWLVALLFVRAAFAEEKYLKIEYRPDLLDSEQIELRLNSVPASPFPGGFGFVVAELKNPDSKPHDVELLVRSLSSQVHFSVRKRIPLDGGGRGRVTLPLPTGVAGSLWFQAVADDFAPGISTGFNESEQRAQPSLLVVRDTLKDAQPFVDLVRDWRGTPAKGRGSGTVDEFEGILASDLPDEWPMLSGFGVIAVDMNASGLDEGKQQRLIDYANAGGALLVFHHRADESPLGKLSQLEASADQSVLMRDRSVVWGDIGLGAYATVADSNAPIDAVAAAIRRTFERTFDLRGPMNSGLAPANMRSGVPIPGLGRVKIKLFLVLILGFVVMIGVVAWRASRRRGASVQLVWKIPAIGLGFAAAIVVFGLMSEGVGVRGAIASVALLDQEAHRAIAVSTRTVYAGLGTGPLKLSPQSALSSSQLQFDVFGDRNHSLEIDLDRERSIGQSLLPSRTPTSLEIVTVAAARERMRFERAGANFKLLASDEFAPIAREKSIVFRDFDGKVYAGSNRGDLVPIQQSEASSIVFNQVSFVLDRTGVTVPPEMSFSMDLVVGSYQALVSNAPYVEDLGIDTNYGDAQVHLVRGKLAREDVK